jgi:hypothetical protein
MGVMGPEGPNDEYDCLLWPLMRMLEEDRTVEELTGFLTTELRDHFGLDPKYSQSSAIAARAKAWFESTWRGTRVPGSANPRM